MSADRDSLPVAVYDGAQVGALDKRFIDTFGVSGFELMQRAAQAAFDALVARWPAAKRLYVLCGPGNNGGDGFLIARRAVAAGWDVRLACLVDPSGLSGDAARAAEAYRETGGGIESFSEDNTEADVVVDAMLGTGVNREVEGEFRKAIAWINRARANGTGVLAVDIASGVDAGTGRIWGEAVQADITPTFIGLKLGALTGAGPAYCGELVFDGLGAPPALYNGQAHAATRIAQSAVNQALKPRARHAHKGDNGHILCVGGNRGMGGSIRMSAEAALRSGAGLASVACHADHAAAMSQARPELMCRGVAAAAEIDPLMRAAEVIAIGPGLGNDDWAESLWHRAVSSDLPLIVDADALQCLARNPTGRGNWILTPHPGEAATLLGCETGAIIADRPRAARAIAERYDAVVVLKGAGSLIATTDSLQVCTAGNPGMAVGGMGDLLTGVIGALRAQGLDAMAAASVGVQIHARAGDTAARIGGERGMIPSDLLEHLRRQVNPAVS